MFAAVLVHLLLELVKLVQLVTVADIYMLWIRHINHVHLYQTQVAPSSGRLRGGLPVPEPYCGELERDARGSGEMEEEEGHVSASSSSPTL